MHTREDIIREIKVAITQQIKAFNECLTPPLKRDFAKIFPHSSYDYMESLLSDLNKTGEITQLEAFEAFAKDLQHQLNPETTALFLSTKKWRVNQTTNTISKQVLSDIERYVENNKIKNHVIVHTENGTVGVLAHLENNRHLSKNREFSRLPNINISTGIARLSNAIEKAIAAIQHVREMINQSQDYKKIVLEKLRAEREKTKTIRQDKQPQPVEIHRDTQDVRENEPFASTNPFALHVESPRVSDQADAPNFNNPFALHVESPRIPAQADAPNLNNPFAPNFMGSAIVSKPTPPKPLKPLVKNKKIPVPPPLPNPQQPVVILRDTGDAPSSETNPFAVPVNADTTIPPVESIITPKPVLPQKKPHEMNDVELNEAIIKTWQDLKQANPVTLEEKIQFLKDSDRSRLMKHGRWILERKADKDPHNDDTIMLLNVWYDNIIIPKRNAIIAEQDFQRQKDLQAFEQKWAEKFNIDFFNDPIALNALLLNLDNGIYPFREEYRIDKQNIIKKYITGKPEDANTDEQVSAIITKFETIDPKNPKEETLFEQFTRRVEMLKGDIFDRAQQLANQVKKLNDDFLVHATIKLPNIALPNNIEILDVNVSEDRKQITKIMEMDSDTAIDDLMQELENQELGFTFNLERLQTIAEGVNFSPTEDPSNTFENIKALLDHSEMIEPLEFKIAENKRNALEYEKILSGIESVQAIYNEREKVLNKIENVNKNILTRVKSANASSLEEKKLPRSLIDNAEEIDPNVLLEIEHQKLLNIKESLTKEITIRKQHIEFMKETLGTLTKLGTFAEQLRREDVPINVNNQASILAHDAKYAKLLNEYTDGITAEEQKVAGCEAEIKHNNLRIKNLEEQFLNSGNYEKVSETIFREALDYIQHSQNYSFLSEYGATSRRKGSQIAIYLNNIDNAKNLEQLITFIQSNPEDPETHKKMRRVRGWFFKAKESTTDSKAKLLQQELVGYFASRYGVDIIRKVQIGKDRVQDILNASMSPGNKK